MPRKIKFIITRLRIGHTKIQRAFLTLANEESSICTARGVFIKHIFTECRIYTSSTEKMLCFCNHSRHHSNRTSTLSPSQSIHHCRQSTRKDTCMTVYSTHLYYVVLKSFLIIICTSLPLRYNIMYCVI